MEYAIDAAAPEQFAVQCRGVMKTYGTGDTKVMALRGIDLECAGASYSCWSARQGAGRPP